MTEEADGFGSARVGPLHAGQADIDPDLVRRLLAEQHPSLADRDPIDVSGTGTVNKMFRIGEDLCVRLPLLASGESALLHELTWLPWLAERLEVEVPEVVAVGEPGNDYPHRWAVYRWIPGSAVPTGSSSPELANDLVTLLESLRRLPAAWGPQAHRRSTLADHDRAVRAGIDEMERELGDQVRRVWESALAADPPAELVWVHGDLMPPNLVMRDCRLAAVIDWGGSGIGDPAADLWCAWSVLDPGRRSEVFRFLGAHPSMIARSRGWVVRTAALGLGYYEHTNPGFVDVVNGALRSVLDYG